MRKYTIRIVCELGIFIEQIFAKNMVEADTIALRKGHKISNYGEYFLESAYAKQGWLFPDKGVCEVRICDFT